MLTRIRLIGLSSYLCVALAVPALACEGDGDADTGFAPVDTSGGGSLTTGAGGSGSTTSAAAEGAMDEGTAGEETAAATEGDGTGDTGEATTTGGGGLDVTPGSPFAPCRESTDCDDYQGAVVACVRRSGKQFGVCAVNCGTGDNVDPDACKESPDPALAPVICKPGIVMLGQDIFARCMLDCTDNGECPTDLECAADTQTGRQLCQ